VKPRGLRFIDETGKYHGYFANQFGEQAVLGYDYQTNEASVRMGDTERQEKSNRGD
jgi:hypothetical protein